MTDTTDPIVAILQAEAVAGDVERNLATLATLAARAADAGADLVVTPELFATGYAPLLAAGIDGAPIRAELAALAARLGLAIVASAPADGGITASFFDADGNELARVAKRHLYGAEERAAFAPAAAYGAPFAWRGITWGMGICYDVEFPEFTRDQALRGAEALLIPTAVPAFAVDAGDLDGAGGYDATLTSTLQVPARALENGLWIAYANHIGAGFTGHSCIASPFGHLSALLPSGEGVALQRAHREAVARARTANTYLTDLP